MSLNILPSNTDNIKKAAKIIKNGGLVAFPTETVYGLGADALNPIAVAKIFEVKKRPYFDPIIVHIASLSTINDLAIDFDAEARLLAENFWPGPLTLILPKSKLIPDIVTAGLSTVAVRMPDQETALKLIREAGGAIAAPSANLFGSLSPTTALHVKAQLGVKVDMILDDGACSIGIESTIIKIDNSEPFILRYGGLPLEEIEDVIGTVNIENTDSEQPASPGRLLSHYSPQTPLQIIDNTDELDLEYNNAGLLAFKPPKTKLAFKMIEVLTQHGDMNEAAANLFSSLHNLDEAGLDIIYAESVVEEGLGKAIMERLKKAEYRYFHEK